MADVSTRSFYGLNPPATVTSSDYIASLGWFSTFSDGISAIVKPGGIGGVLRLPQRTITLTDTITFNQLYGFILDASGPVATEFVWAGPADRPMFLVNRCQSCVFKNFSVSASSSHPLLEVFRVQNGPADSSTYSWPSLTSSNNLFENIVIRGGGHIGVGFRNYLYDPVNDDKNDFQHFRHVVVSGCTWAAFALEGRNAKSLTLEHAIIEPTSSGIYTKYGVITAANFCPGDDGFDEDLSLASPLYNHGAQFRWFGGAFQGCSESNLLIGDRNGGISVRGAYSEKSGRWLVMPNYTSVGGAGGAAPVLLEDCDYNESVNTPADRELVQCYANALTIKSCCWSEHTAGQQYKIRYTPRTEGAFVYEGNTISNDGDGVVFVDSAPTNTNYTVTNLAYISGSLAQLGAAV